MFYRKRGNNKTNKLHDMILRIFSLKTKNLVLKKDEDDSFYSQHHDIPTSSYWNVENILKFD